MNWPFALFFYVMLLNDMEQKSFINTFAEIKAQGDQGVFTGLGSVFGNIDKVNDIVEPGAFKESLKRNGFPALLLQHNPENIGGVFTDVKETKEGLVVQGQLNMEVQRAREAFAFIKQGALKGLSIGFIPIEQEVDKKGINHIMKVDLLEVSLVTFPANPLAVVLGHKNMPNTEREFEKFLRDSGYDRTAAKAITSQGIKGYRNVLRDAGVLDDLSNDQRDAGELKESLSKLLISLRSAKCQNNNQKSKK